MVDLKDETNPQNAPLDSPTPLLKNTPDALSSPSHTNNPHSNCLLLCDANKHAPKQHLHQIIRPQDRVLFSNRLSHHTKDFLVKELAPDLGRLMLRIL